MSRARALLTPAVAALGFISCLSLSTAEHAGQESALFAPVGDFPLGAGVNRTDYESIDAAARRLYVAKMGGGQLVVFDIDRNKLVAAFDGYPKVTGVLVVPELHKVYASVPGAGVGGSLAVGIAMLGLSSGSGMVIVRDTQSLKEVAKQPVGVFPDGIAFDPKAQKIFVSDELGSAVTVVDAESDHLVARIKTGGEVGNVRYDALNDTVYVPDQSHDELLTIDPNHAVVSARRALTGCDHPHGLVIAPVGDIAYVACDGNDQLLTVDLSGGRVLGRQPVAHDPDVLAVDTETSRLYVAAESGSLSTFDIRVQNAPKPLGDEYIAEGAHAVAVDPVSHRLYFALASKNGLAVLRVLAPK